ncbi:lysozyme inhibitor LprI family protein [Jannaschia aquimarina]|uniref:Lysozyme inhibitor LprI-like N-terminal domain-containing protein n=1 Tax=Jannaschia aquimarina TaxID=935700 RepID=A0A0D1EP57_9RHOB|nr:lysozyme inhibitor LprI family protein [Jannaschia aquimarina]KIT17430.1 hypothetical protein jaqu_08450 [Jannaschia aquimarina]SNT23949.1 Uncharacterized conserved protein YecT, DUF1311 family [Jannaschia aquimarina]
MRALIIPLALMAAPSAAQEIVFDPSPVEICLSVHRNDDRTPDCVGAAAETCMEQTDGGYSTVGMAKCTNAETDEWDRLLNAEYQALRAELEEADARFGGGIDRSDAIRDAQRAWIAFRDADCMAKYAQYQDGTIRTTIGTICHLTHTARRTLELRGMREGLDGDL